MNNLRNYLGLSALTMGLCLMSCNDDNTPSYSQTTMKNSELKTILQQKGYQFNEQGNLLLDDLANNTTTLDLSGTKLSDLSELDRAWLKERCGIWNNKLSVAADDLRRGKRCRMGLGGRHPRQPQWL